MARVVKKNNKKNWSNSRGEGCVFDFELKDASGVIKVTAFNDEVNKYFDMIQEGKIYYLSNGKIQPVRKPEYNNVSTYLKKLNSKIKCDFSMDVHLKNKFQEFFSEENIFKILLFF